MRVDYHTHHHRCGHAVGEMVEYVEKAIAAGLDEIGLSDHAPIFHCGEDPHPIPGGAMSQLELSSYVAEAESLRRAFAGRIEVRLGIESDFVPGWGPRFRDLWRRYPLDYVIGSIHWVDGWNIFSARPHPRLSPEELYASYLRATRQAAESGAYDVIGHLDGLKTYGHLPDRGITPLLEDTVAALAASGVAIELNTSGWRNGCAEPHPRRELLALCQHHGVPVTLGSDAHAPDQVAAGFDDAIALLKEVGYSQIAVFKKRRRRLVGLG